MELPTYIGVARQTALFRKLDVIAHNLANVNSTGFKAEHTMFEQYKVHSLPGKTPVHFGYDVATFRDQRQGPLQMTHNPLDTAIDGEGFFKIQTPLGIRYSRMGSFKIDSTGTLVNAQGYNVLGTGNAPIVFDEQDIEVSFRENGLVTANLNGAIEERGQLDIVAFENEYELTRQANGLYSSEANPAPAAETDFTLVQGALEGSNVNSIAMLTDLIQTQRSAISASKSLKDLHDLQRRAISTIGGQQ